MSVRELVWPDVAVERRATGPGAERYVRSYLFMRALVGALGLALPLVLAFGGRRPLARGSLSAYYYSGLRDVFVGVLCAIGVFLLAYKVAERSRENVLTLVAGVAAIVVALFPTARPGRGFALTPLQQHLGEGVVETVHFTAAVVFIAALGLISWYFAQPPPVQTGERSRSFWRRYHLVCVGVIGAALVLGGVTAVTGQPDKGILYAEWAAVWAFGASWFMKGAELRRLFPKPS